MNLVSSNETIRCVAVLHDTLEDTYITDLILRNHGISEEVIEAVNLLTHDKDITYRNYILNLKRSAIAREVKLADLTDNMDVTKVPARFFGKGYMKQLVKYHNARELLL